MAGVGFQRENFEGNSQGKSFLRERVPVWLGNTSLEPRLSVPDFVSQLWRKATKAARQNPEREKAARQHRERKPWVRGYRVWVFLVVRCNRLELDCSWLNLDL